MMKNSKKWMCRAVLFLCLTVLGASFFMMAQAEPIIPEDYDGLVILEDPALLGGPEDEEEAEPPATEPPATEAPATEVPTVEPTSEPTNVPTVEPTEPPEAAYEITMAPPEGWYLNRAVMELTITDLNGTGWENVKITLNNLTLIDGELPSGHMWIELLDNCDVMVTVTDPYGQEHSEKVEIRCFDHTAPELKASIQGEFLQVEASDAQSGVAAIQINGTVYDHTSLTNGRLELSLKQYADAYEQLLVQAVDQVGNTSKAIALANPFFHNTPVTTPGNTKKPGGSSHNNSGSSGNRATASPTAEPTLAPKVTATAAPYTEIESGFPFSSAGNSFTRDLLYDRATNKQFIAIETRNGDLFYMIIDYDKPLDEKGEKYETYFLNLVDSRDLLDIVDAKDIPDEPEVIYVTPEPTEVPTQSPSNEERADVQKPDSSKTMLGLAGIAMLAGGGALWYFKQKKGKKRPPVQDYDFDSDEEEETNDKDE
jgi:hypothetical protein